MKEVRITVQIDLVEGYDRQRCRQDITITPVADDGSTEHTKALVVDYALMDHAFRKLDAALDLAKQSVRDNAKTMSANAAPEEAPL